jgi:ParB family chromosome partitioning protein
MGLKMNEEKRVGKILYLEGKTNLVVFAPHARKNDDKKQYEEKTDNIAKALHDNLHCHVFINDKVKRDDTDYNDIKFEKEDPAFLSGFHKLVKNLANKQANPVYIVTIHGYDSTKNKKLKEIGRAKNPPTFLLGWGDDSCQTADNETIKKLIQKLSPDVIDGFYGFKGSGKTNFVQLYRKAPKKYREKFPSSLCDRIEAIQIEIELSARSGDKWKETANRLEKALTDSLSLVSIPRVSTIPFEEIDPDSPYNYRLHQYDNKAEELEKSIEEQDLLQSLLVQEQEGQRYRLISGHRRYEALKQLQKDRPYIGEIAVNILPKETSPEQLFKMSFEENTERRELNPLEMGNFLAAAKKELNLESDRELAEHFPGFFAKKRSRQLVNKYLNLYEYYEDNQSPEIIEAMCRLEKPLGYSLALSIAEKCENRGGVEARNLLFQEIVVGLKASRSALTNILKIMKKLCSLKEIPTFKELLNLEEIKEALNTAKQANSQKASIFLRHLEKLTGQEETPTDKSIERILSTVRDTQGVILKKTAAKRYRITINVDFNDPEKLLDSLKSFINRKKWKPFLQKNIQEENVEAVGQQGN